MKRNIVLNTTYDSATTKVFVTDLVPQLEKAGYVVTRNDWKTYNKYDAAFFLSPDSQVQKAKAINPNILTGILDAKITSKRIPEIQAADFVVVTSLEQREAMVPLNDNVHVYYTFPRITNAFKKHEYKETTLIGYHGNKEHLLCFYPKISDALDRLAEKHNIELIAMYNIKGLGKWKRGLPKKVPVRHIQWSPENYTRELAKADIGICNSEIPINEPLSRYTSRYLIRRPRISGYPYNHLDHISRFKYPTNPGRIYVFSELGIPVIADYSPSMSQVVTDSVNGYIVHTTNGWYWALDQLIRSPEKRQKFSDNLRNNINTQMHPDVIFNNFHNFLEGLLKNSKLPRSQTL